MQNEWLNMHSKTVDKILHDIATAQMKNTINGELNLNNISFIIKSMKQELFKEMQKSASLETELSGMKIDIEKLKETIVKLEQELNNCEDSVCESKN